VTPSNHRQAEALSCSWLVLAPTRIIRFYPGRKQCRRRLTVTDRARSRKELRIGAGGANAGIMISLPILPRSTTGHLPRRCVTSGRGDQEGTPPEALCEIPQGPRLRPAPQRPGRAASSPVPLTPVRGRARAGGAPRAISRQRGSRLQGVATRGLMASCQPCCLIAMANRDRRDPHSSATCSNIVPRLVHAFRLHDL
jgi:hypothetical protein